MHIPLFPELSTKLLDSILQGFCFVLFLICKGVFCLFTWPFFFFCACVGTLDCHSCSLDDTNLSRIYSRIRSIKTWKLCILYWQQIFWSGSQNSGNHLPASNWFIIKRCNSGIPRWKSELSKRWGKGAEHPYPLQVNHCPCVFTFTNPEALWALCFWIFMEASLNRHDCLSQWPLVIDPTFRPPSLPKGRGVGWDEVWLKVPRLIIWLITLAPSPHF